jgi:hypothetical protein
LLLLGNTLLCGVRRLLLSIPWLLVRGKSGGRGCRCRCNGTLLLDLLGLRQGVLEGLLPLVLRRVRCHIKAPVDALRDGLNFSAELLLDLVKVESILVGNKVDCQTKVTKTT